MMIVYPHHTQVIELLLESAQQAGLDQREGSSKAAATALLGGTMRDAHADEVVAEVGKLGAYKPEKGRTTVG